MNLLPDCTLEEHKFSLQNPYTIDGRLPECFDWQCNDDQIHAEIMLDNGILILLDTSNAPICYTPNTDWRDENGNEIINKPSSVKQLLDRISYQTHCMQILSNQKEKYLRRLQRQNRIHFYPEYINQLSPDIDNLDTTVTGLNYSPTLRTLYNNRLISRTTITNDQPTLSYEENLSNLSEISNYINTVSSILSGVSEPSTQPTLTPEKKYIHEYNYKPDYIKHFMPDEDSASTLLLGVEIEVGGNNLLPWNPGKEKEMHVKRCIQIMNGSESDEETLIYSTYDSTVQLELDTMPCSIAFHKEKMNYKELFDYLDKQGYKGHDCKSAGLHIHANRSYLGRSKLIQQLTISKILYLLEKFNDEICVIARRSSDYSRFMGAGKNEDTVVELYQKYDRSKHVALNLTHKDTIEFRCFKSTLKYETFILTLEFVNKIIDFAKAINIEEIETIEWNTLLDTFSNELKEYYYFRKEKEEKKKQKKASKEVSSPNEVRDCLGYDWGALFSTEGIGSYASFSPVRVAIGNSIYSFRNDTVTIDTRTEKEKERDELKKKIKNTKKKVSNTRNILEKMNLQRELNRMQKDLKELNKKIKQESLSAH